MLVLSVYNTKPVLLKRISGNVLKVDAEEKQDLQYRDKLDYRGSSFQNHNS